jgi:predicted alpha/beta superfamily hydrolase
MGASGRFGGHAKGAKRMRQRHLLLAIAAAFLLLIGTRAQAYQVGPAGPLTIGETFTLRSSSLGEDRRINVYFPPGFSHSAARKLPVMYLPDGGMAEQFLHVAGLLQASMADRVMRPFILVGIENTNRRRDLTTVTQSSSDLAYANEVGGSQPYRTFLRTELMLEIAKRYPVSDESAILGASLAGLFVVETFLLEPDLFDTYIAFDPSLWWNDQWLLLHAEAVIENKDRSGKTIVLASSAQAGMAVSAARLDAAFAACKKGCAAHHYLAMPEYSHETLFTPAALQAFRKSLAPRPAAAPAP